MSDLGESEIDGDALPFPVAVPRGIELLLLARGRIRRQGVSGLRNRWGFAKMRRRIEMSGTFHDVKMSASGADAKS